VFVGSSRENAQTILSVCLILLVVVHWETASSILQTWSRDPFGHGFFVVPVAACLAWNRRRQIPSSNPPPAVAAFSVLGGLSILWLLGSLTGTIALKQSCLVAMLIALAWAIIGSAATRALVFPLGLLVFALPVGDAAGPVLQEITSRCATKVLVFSGVPAILEDHVIVIAGTRWQVTEACGGINYVIAAVTFAYIYAGLAYRTWRHRLALMGAAILLSLAGNGARVYTTILLDYAGATRMAAGTLHELYGVFLFALLTGVLVVTCGRWKEERLPGSRAMAIAPDGVGMSGASTRRIVQCAISAMLVIGSGPAAARVLSSERGLEGKTPKPPVVSAPWKAVADELSSWSPHFMTPRSEFVQSYQAGNNVVKLYVAFYDALQPGVNMTSRANTLFAPPWWRASERERTIVFEGTSLQLRETLLRSGESSLLVWGWYEIDGRTTGHRYAAKLLIARAGLFGIREGCRALAVATKATPDGEADGVLREFVAHMAFPTGLQRTSSVKLTLVNPGSPSGTQIP
jgi:exosortase A